jgi:hypothetical protein
LGLSRNTNIVIALFFIVTDPIQRTVFFAIMILIPFWFVLLKAIFDLLQKKHPEKYKEMGSPSIFWNYSMRTAISIYKLIGRREHKQLANSGLSKLCDFALILITLYLILFIGGMIICFLMIFEVQNFGPYAY